MPNYTVNLKAGQPTRQIVGAARFLTLQDLGAASGVDVDIEIAGTAREQFRNIRPRDRLDIAPGFQAVSFTAAVDCVIEIVASLVDVRLNNGDGQTVNATIVGPLPVPVETSRGLVPGTPLFVSGITYNDTPAGSAVDRAAVAVTDAGAVLVAADGTRMRAYFTNIGNDAVALGAPGITWAKRAILLYPGDSWLEEKGAALAWSAITDVGTDASVTIQELKA